jgi:hypothetical protein
VTGLGKKSGMLKSSASDRIVGLSFCYCAGGPLFGDVDQRRLCVVATVSEDVVLYLEVRSPPPAGRWVA